MLLSPSLLPFEDGNDVSCFALFPAALNSDLTTLRTSPRCPRDLPCFPNPNIQIQIESLHTRLDETDEMTSAGGIPAGPFPGARTTRAPYLRSSDLRSPQAVTMPRSEEQGEGVESADG